MSKAKIVKKEPAKVPPIKIQGIKTKLVPWIIENVSFPENGRWVEPFMGSAVVGLNYGAKRALFCDSNPHTISFYNLIGEGVITSVSVRKFLEEEGAKLSAGGLEYYLEVRKRFNELGNPMDFLFLNRSCFNGIIRFNKKFKFNVPFGKKPDRFAKSYVTKIVNQVAFIEKKIKSNEWEFKCQDFSQTLTELEPNDFIYCDPPYIGRNVDYFDSWSEENEFQLHDLLVNSGNRFLLSTWDSNEYRTNTYLETLWNDCNKLNKNHFYHVGAKESNRKPMLEALIFNYSPIEIPEIVEQVVDEVEAVHELGDEKLGKRKKGRPKKEEVLRNQLSLVL